MMLNDDVSEASFFLFRYYLGVKIRREKFTNILKCCTPLRRAGKLFEQLKVSGAPKKEQQTGSTFCQHVVHICERFTEELKKNAVIKSNHLVPVVLIRTRGGCNASACESSRR